MQNKIGILSLPCNPNYGFVLQQWALYFFLKNKGFDVIVLNRRWNAKKNGLKKKIITFLYLNTFCRPFYCFWKKMPHSPELRSSKELKKFVDKENINLIVVGSDQVWRIEHTRGADLNYFCDFIADEKIKKISYAASFGSANWQGTDVETKKISSLIKTFDGISVRENDGVEICKKFFGVNAELVLDPTFLLSCEDYKKLLKKKNIKPYVASYILDYSSEKMNFIKKIADGRNIIQLRKRKKWMFFFHMSVYNWLSSIFYAEYVIVDSFHGMVFSIIFKKDFFVIANSRRGNSRFSSLLSLLGLEDRLINDISDFNSDRFQKIDYQKVYENLNRYRKHSMNFLLNSVGKLGS